jgi:hypothetical protein
MYIVVLLLEPVVEVAPMRDTVCGMELDVDVVVVGAVYEGGV